MATTTAIDEVMIDRLIRAFYERAQADPLLGPVFDGQVHDWEAHFAQMRDFWSAILLGTGRYRGRPMAKHLPLAIDAVHFERWLYLFAATAREVCPAGADIIIERARGIGASLAAGVSLYRASLSAE